MYMHSHHSVLPIYLELDWCHGGIGASDHSDPEDVAWGGDDQMVGILWLFCD